jgi:hypothetical protein
VSLKIGKLVDRIHAFACDPKSILDFFDILEKILLCALLPPSSLSLPQLTFSGRTPSSSSTLS